MTCRFCGNDATSEMDIAFKDSVEHCALCAWHEGFYRWMYSVLGQSVQKRDIDPQHKRKGGYMHTFDIGMKVRILLPLREGIEQQGTIYNYLPSRPCPWHVRPDGYAQDEYGIAFTEAEIEPMEAKSVYIGKTLPEEARQG